MEEVLPDPTNWADLETNKEQLDNFIESFTHANQQLNTVQQYYTNMNGMIQISV